MRLCSTPRRKEAHRWVSPLELTRESFILQASPFIVFTFFFDFWMFLFSLGVEGGTCKSRFPWNVASLSYRPLSKRLCCVAFLPLYIYCFFFFRERRRLLGNILAETCICRVPSGVLATLACRHHNEVGGGATINSQKTSIFPYGRWRAGLPHSFLFSWIRKRTFLEGVFVESIGVLWWCNIRLGGKVQP